MNYRIEYRVDNYMSTHYKFVQAPNPEHAEREFEQIISSQIPDVKVNIVEISLVVEKNDAIMTVPV